MWDFEPKDMQDVAEFFSNLFQAENWPPRWHCGKWTSFHGWLYIFSNLAIWAAYFAIPLILFIFITKRKTDIPFIKIFWLFIAFILACGTTHLIDATLFYYPAYRLSALVLFICAIVSWATIFGLIKILPDALKLKTPTQLEHIIHSRTKELQVASLNLEKQNNQLRDFAQITSHNLRAPVSNLITLLDLYKIDESEKNKADYLEKFDEAADKLMQTINELSEVVKINSDRDIKREQITFQSILNETVESLSALIDKRNATITSSFEKFPQINYPTTYLQSIFLNLLTNALKYSSPERKPSIHFETTKIADKCVLKCRDNGVGIDLNKYGDKMFRLNKTFHGNEDARGLGLFITKNQVEAMGGTITVESEPNKGSTFIINFN